MGKVRRIQLTIKTGELGHDEPIMMAFNGHEVLVKRESGDAQAGATFIGQFEPDSVAHSVALCGPRQGRWAIETLHARYTVDGETYEVGFGPFALDDTTNADIWDLPPIPAWDV